MYLILSFRDCLSHRKPQFWKMFVISKLIHRCSLFIFPIHVSIIKICDMEGRYIMSIYRRLSNKYIYRSLCDGYQDCSQGEDEESCPTSAITTIPQPNTTASSGVTGGSMSATKAPKNITLSTHGSKAPTHTTSSTTSLSPTKNNSTTPGTQTSLAHTSHLGPLTTKISPPGAGDVKTSPTTPMRTTMLPIASGKEHLFFT